VVWVTHKDETMRRSTSLCALEVFAVGGGLAILVEPVETLQRALVEHLASFEDILLAYGF
jgi:hypothetical protein